MTQIVEKRKSPAEKLNGKDKNHCSNSNRQLIDPETFSAYIQIQHNRLFRAITILLISCVYSDLAAFRKSGDDREHNIARNRAFQPQNNHAPSSGFQVTLQDRNRP